MSWFSSSGVSIDAQVEKATDESIPFGETDLATSLEITDLIRSKQVAPKEAMRSLKRRLTSTKNPNTQLSTLHLIDTCVKNGGNHFIMEISTREFIDSLVSLVHDDRCNENVRDLALDLIQNWAIAFKDNFQFKYVVSTYDHLKADGYSFPPIGAPLSSTLFDSSAPPEWEDSDACMICSNAFSMLNRKHHCRNCGGVFCQTHSSKSIPLPHLGITDSVRVCDNCYDEYHSKTSHTKSKKHRRSKHQKEVSHARAQYDSDDDDDLKRALELSLKESQGYAQVPVIPAPAPVKSAPPAASSTADDEDEEMKAAIAASLKEFEQEKHRTQQSQSAPPPADSSPYADLLPQSSTQYQSQSYSQPKASSPNISEQQQQQQLQSQSNGVGYPSNFLTSQEETDIRQFATKTQELKNSPALAVENPQLNDLYRKAIPLTPKLSTELNDSMGKYERFVDMNSKIDAIMRMYNNMLDARIERENQQRQQMQHHPPQQSPFAQASYPPQGLQYQHSYGYSPQAQPPMYTQTPQNVPSPVQQYQQSNAGVHQYQTPQVTSVQSSPQQSFSQPIHTQSPQAEYQRQPLPQPTYQQQQASPYPSQPTFSIPSENSITQVPQYKSEDMTSEPPNNISPVAEDPFQDQAPVEEEQQEEEEEEEEFTAPPSEPTHQSHNEIYEPHPEHVANNGSSYLPQAASYPPPPPPQQQQIPQQFTQGYQQNNYQYHPQYQQQQQSGKITDVTFPSVPLNKPPTQTQNQAATQYEPAKEETLIEL